MQGSAHNECKPFDPECRTEKPPGCRGARSAATCSEIEHLLQPHVAMTMVEYRDDLTPAERSLILETMAIVKQQLANLAKEADLTPHVIDVRRHIVALLSVEWADLVDTRPAALSRYGAMDAQTANDLEPVIEDLIERVNTLVGTLQAPRPSR